MSLTSLSLPDITPRDIEAVVQVLRSERLSQGPRQARFEEAVAERAGRRHGVAVSSGTAGLHLALAGLGVGPGDEVITTPFGSVAAANAILYQGAKPVFVDIDPRTLNLDPARVEAALTPRTKAILAVDAFGDPALMDRLASIALGHEIPLIEDAGAGLGGRHKDRPAGSFGRAGVFGFFQSRQVTTGEGGMIVTDDDQLADACRSLRNHGRPVVRGTEIDDNVDQAGGWLLHERLGYNYRLSEIAAALGLSQMERLDQTLAARRRVVAMYMHRLMDWPELVLPTVEPADVDHRSWFLFVVRLADSYGQTERDRIITGLRRHDIAAANHFPCIHLQPCYRQAFGFQKGLCPVAESVSQRTLALPLFTRMDETHVELVCHTLKVMIQREQLLRR